MLDRFNRTIHYMRISVTDKCNLRCAYCMPPEGIDWKPHSEILSFEAIQRVAAAAAGLGIDKIRLTGGEPLVRKDIVKLVEMIARIDSIRTVGITTNGILLPRFAVPLKAAGLSRVNVSLDTLDPDRYREITRGGRIEEALEGIRAADQAGFTGTKINMVVMNETDQRDIDRMRMFCGENGLTLRLINHYELKQEKLDSYIFDRPPKCGDCNRIRLTADGKLKPCLHTNTEILLDFNNLEESLKQAIYAKPGKGEACTNRNMIEIGG